MKFDLDHTYSSGRLQAIVDCSLTYHEFIKSRMYNESGQKFSSASYSDFKKLWEDRGLTAEVYDNYQSMTCPENHTRCSDSDAVFVGGATDCVSTDCHCVKQVSAITAQSSNIKPVNSELDTPKILGLTALGIVSLLAIQYSR